MHRLPSRIPIQTASMPPQRLGCSKLLGPWSPSRFLDTVMGWPEPDTAAMYPVVTSSVQAMPYLLVAACAGTTLYALCRARHPPAPLVPQSLRATLIVGAGILYGHAEAAAVEALARGLNGGFVSHGFSLLVFGALFKCGSLRSSGALMTRGSLHPFGALVLRDFTFHLWCSWEDWFASCSWCPFPSMVRLLTMALSYTLATCPRSGDVDSGVQSCGYGPCVRSRMV